MLPTFVMAQVNDSPVLPLHWMRGVLNATRGAAYSPDKTMIAIAGTGGVVIYDTATGAQIRTFTSAVSCMGETDVAFSPDSKSIVVAGAGGGNNGGLVEFWNISTGELQRLFQPSFVAYSVVFTPDGKSIALGGSLATNHGVFGEVGIWNLASGTSQRSFSTTDFAGISAVAISPDGKTIACGGGSYFSKGLLAAWNISSGQQTQSFPTQSTQVSSVTYSPDGTRIIDGGNPNVLEIWNASTAKKIASLPTGSSSVLSVSISPDGTKLLAPQERSQSVVELWDLTTDQLSATIPTSATAGVSFAAFSSDGKSLAIVGRTPITEGVGMFEIWDATTLTKKLGQIVGNQFNTYEAFMPDGKTLAVAGENFSSGSPSSESSLNFWDVATGAWKGSLGPPNTDFGAFAISPDGSILVSNTGIWNISTGALIAPLNTSPIFQITQILFSPDGTKFVVFGENASLSTVELWTLSTLNSVASITLPAVLTGAAFTPDGKRVAVGGSDSAGNGVLEMLSATDLSVAQTLPTQVLTGGISSVSISPDGSSLADVATNTYGVQIEIWNLATGKIKATAQTATNTALLGSSVFSHDGKTLIIGTDAGIQAFNSSTGAFIGQSYGIIGQLSLSPISNQLAFLSGLPYVDRSNFNGYGITDDPFDLPGINSFTISPTAVTGGTAATGTVTLSETAPLSGTVVTLTSNNVAVSAPSTVKILSGASSATFSLATAAVSVAKTATVTATANGSSTSANLTVNPPALLSLTVSPTTLSGGSSATGTVTLSGPAPAGGTSVSLASSYRSASVPVSVTVAAGQTSAQFTVTTQAISLLPAVTISATLGTVTKSVTLNITSLSLVSLSLNPSTVTGGTPSTGTVTLTGPAPTGGIVVALNSALFAAQVPASVKVSAGHTSATFTITTTAVASQTTSAISATVGASSQSAILTITPPQLQSLNFSPTTVIGTNSSVGVLTISSVAPMGGLFITLTSDSSVASPSVSTLKVPGGQTSASFTVATTAVARQTTAHITASGLSGQLTTALIVNPPALIHLSFAPVTVTGGQASVGTVTLGTPAPAGGLAVTLASANSAVTVPSSVTVAAGKTSATFAVSTIPVRTATTVSISATVGTTSQTASITVSPTALLSLLVNSLSPTGGQIITGTVNLVGPAPAGGVYVSLSSSNAHAVVSASVLVPAGKSSATFSITTKAVTVTTSVTLTAVLGVTKTLVFNIKR
jgi:dipeptidyl aminopeptidase/acylaminoacyl peptidase